MPKRTPASSTPAFTSEDVYLKVFNLQDKIANVHRMPKPKPKIQKPAKNGTDKTKSSQEKAKSSDTTSEESQQSQSNESVAESNVSDNENVDTEINDLLRK
ncbi:hypothetical protein TIFTF001_001629 [Ficus carica]|uniref:Uncharacterized protein n=1 Tax=Ficus carica TaxID=3494 RepID=A0AA87Z7K7_FICCA|nr:hypothetical protein TIFTF001_001629 [Ficus carica]